MARKKDREPVLVIGLGRFGGAVAASLAAGGHEVLAVDQEPRRVQEWSGRLTRVVEVDTTSEDAMRQIGADEFAVAVVAIGTDMEASILTVGVLADLGVPTIWAKALTRAHGRILQRIGATRVVFPEHEMGEKVAHMVTGRMMDYIEFDDGFTLVETVPPRDVVGHALGDSGIRSRWGVTVVCIKRPGEDFTYATADTVVTEDALLVVAGKRALTERFANET